MGWWPSRATTFLENHDTVSSRALQAYAQVMQSQHQLSLFAYKICIQKLASAWHLLAGVTSLKSVTVHELTGAVAQHITAC